jgi:hypothetical protein
MFVYFLSRLREKPDVKIMQAHQATIKHMISVVVEGGAKLTPYEWSSFLWCWGVNLLELPLNLKASQQ